MKEFIIFTILVVLWSTNANICSTRKQWGFACDGCAKRVMCVSQNNVWDTINIETCPSGSACSADGQKCVESDDRCAEVATEPFVCRSEGTFIDPYDCTKYHFCFKIFGVFDVVTVTCPTGTAFSVSTLSCSLEREDNVCLERQFRCPSLGYMAVWPHSRHIYYICLTAPSDPTKLFPALYRCAGNQRFDGSKCTTAIVPFPVDRQDGETTAPPVTQSPQPTIPTTPTTPKPPPFQCAASGSFKHPTDCTKYYYCDTKLNSKGYDCNKGFYYETKFGSCIRGSC